MIIQKSKAEIANSLNCLSGDIDAASYRNKPLLRFNDIVTLLKAGQFKAVLPLLKDELDQINAKICQALFRCHSIGAGEWAKMGDREVRFYIEDRTLMVVARIPGQTDETVSVLGRSAYSRGGIAQCVISDDGPYAVLNYRRGSRRSGLTYQAAILVKMDPHTHEFTKETVLSGSRAGRMRPSPNFFSSAAIELTSEGKPQVVLMKRGHFFVVRPKSGSSENPSENLREPLREPSENLRSFN